MKSHFMAKHLHIALQHTSKEMLKIMNRRNKVLSDLELLSLKENGYALGTDFIVGHPGETDYYGEKLWKIFIISFNSYSCFYIFKRDGTPSATMKPEVKAILQK